jgi:hypothetical protein
MPVLTHRTRLEELAVATQERFTLRNLYLYLVCLITLVIGIFAAVTLVRNIVELAYPAPDYGFDYAVPAAPPGRDKTAETDADRERRLKLEREARQREAVLGLVGSGTTLLTFGPLYAYHWRKVQAELRAGPSQPAGGEPPG